MYHGKYQCNWSLQLAEPGLNQPGISSGGSGQENIADRKICPLLDCEVPEGDNFSHSFEASRALVVISINKTFRSVITLLVFSPDLDLVVPPQEVTEADNKSSRCFI